MHVQSLRPFDQKRSQGRPGPRDRAVRPRGPSYEISRVWLPELVKWVTHNVSI
jgi:hypothetical protein